MPKKELHFSIEGTTPQTFPMARLASYLRELATLLGSEDDIHFLRVEDGSAKCAMEIDAEIEPTISERVWQAKKGFGPKDAVKALKTIRLYLEEDDTSAFIEWDKGEVLIEFPRKSQGNEQTYGPFWEDGSLDGMLIKIGGTDETVPVHLLYEGVQHNCNTTRELARRLAPYIFGRTIRVHGRGKWYRNSEGKWELRWFDIRDFEELDDASLLDVVGRLRAIPHNDLMKSNDPLGDIIKIRHG
jgi:hypothetical protein